MSFQAPNRALLPRRPAIIGSELRERGTGAIHAHIYPATGQATCEIAMAGTQEVDEAVRVARAAFPAWRAMPGDKRRDLLLKLASLIEQHSNELTELLTVENGAPILVGPYMVLDAVQKFRYYAGWADKIHGQTVAHWGAPSHNYVAHEPYGVIGAIVPWNGPLYAATMVMAPALAAGNCIVVKAPELAPFSVMRLGELFLEAGFPPGVVNTLVGGADVGEAIVTHAGVDKVQFVGSGATAKKVLRSASEQLKPCGLELGGKSAVLVFADADLQQSAKAVCPARSARAGRAASTARGCLSSGRFTRRI
jgi:aldehyde dehydrogenase (NAD+)